MRSAVLSVALASASLAGVNAAAPIPTVVSASALPATYTYSPSVNSASEGQTPTYGAIYDARSWPDSVISTITGGQVNYVESQFEDNFETFNLTRWIPSGSYQSGSAATISTPWSGTKTVAQGPAQDHCPAAGAVGAASPGTCTLLTPQSLQTGISLVGKYGYNIDAAASPPDLGKGAVMTLSQKSCYDQFGNNVAACCTTSTLKNGQKTQVCASWAGTHLSSAFGVQYGILETEAAFNLTLNGGAYYVFFGSYMYGGSIPSGATAVDQSCAFYSLGSLLASDSARRE